MTYFNLFLDKYSLIIKSGQIDTTILKMAPWPPHDPSGPVLFSWTTNYCVQW